jgi:flagellar assembly factor FliW
MLDREFWKSGNHHQNADSFLTLKLRAPMILDKHKTSLMVIFLRNDKWKHGGSVNAFFKFWFR